MKYYIISGEASGDLHGANLMNALLKREPDASIRFWGGDRMSAVAKAHTDGQVVQVRHIRDLAYMGIIEVVGHLGTVMGNINFCKSDIISFKPDVVIFIDYPGFNLKIAKFTHSQGLRNLYYISPQIWAWKKGRLRSMRRDLDKLCYILPSERSFYAENSMPQALYVGHPLLDEVARYNQQKKNNSHLSGNSRKSNDNFNFLDSPASLTNVPWPANLMSKLSTPKIALLPGSRKHELKKMMPIMMALANRHPDLQFQIAGMSLVGEDYYRRFMPSGIKNVTLVFDSTYQLLSESWAAVVCSGTATLETCLFGVPQMVCYQANKISAAIARLLISKKLKYISLVNLIADAPVVRELIQGDVRIDRVDQEFQAIVSNPSRRSAIIDGYRHVYEVLGNAGASDRVAELATLIAHNHC